jgi:hypothetical protein
MSLIFEARQRLSPNPTGDAAEAASTPEFEDEFDIEAALVDVDGSDLQPAQHETQLSGSEQGLENARSTTNDQHHSRADPPYLQYQVYFGTSWRSQEQRP